MRCERFDTVVVGGGQTGLTVGYHLALRDQSFVILDANQRVGDSWRQRWDSLRLFTPARYNGLPGWPFPAAPWSFPSRDEMADYLEAYAARFDLPVRSGVRVDQLGKENNRYVLTSADRRIEADNVVVAMGSFQRPRRAAFAAELEPGIVQLHSHEYATRPSCAPAVSSWWAPVTREPISPSTSPAITARGCPAGMSVTSPAASTVSRHGCCFAWYSDSSSTER